MRIRLFYAAYFVAVAVAIAFWPPYLRGLGLTGLQVSHVLVIGPVLHLAAPVLWGWLADRTRRPARLLGLACGGACLLAAPLIFIEELPALLALWTVAQVFAVAVSGLSDGLAIERARQGDDYGRMRVWGSLSFSLACALIGVALAARGSRAADRLVPALYVLSLGAASVIAFGLDRGPSDAATERPHLREVRALVADRRFRFLLVIAPLHWIATAPYHGFFSILLQDLGASPALAGNAFAIAVGAEVVVLSFFRRLTPRVSLPGLLVLATGASVLRWALCAAVRAPAALAVLQILHGFTFGVFWATCLAWIGACVPSRLRATGQTLFTAATFGLGNIAGMLGAGALYDATGGARMSFAVAALFELLPFALAVAAARSPTLAPGSEPAAGSPPGAGASRT